MSTFVNLKSGCKPDVQRVLTTCQPIYEKKAIRKRVVAHHNYPFLRGPGGIRTLVQTGKPYAFYTFIPAFDFRATARPGPPTGALAPKFSSCCRGPTRLFPIYLHRLILRFGTTSLERCLVPSSDDGIKPVIYCTSIRQRERNCFRQLIFDN